MTTAFHPSVNGMIEKPQRQLKAVLKCHNNQRWVEILPVALLGIHTAIKEDLKMISAELLYNKHLRLLGTLLLPSKAEDTSKFLNRLRGYMRQLTQTPAQHHGRRQIFISKDLSSCSHIFLHHNAIRKPMNIRWILSCCESK